MNNKNRKKVFGGYIEEGYILLPSGKYKGKIVYDSDADTEATNYDGEFELANGEPIKSGYGIACYENGRYEGNFKNNCRDGKGKFYYKDEKETYIGQWKKGKIDGYGTYYFANGIKYEGQFENNKMHGKGTMYFKNGEKYVGEFKEGKKEGKGTLYYENNKVKYEGNFKGGKKNGEGKYNYGNGDCFIGNFKNDKRNGEGRYLFKGSSILEGIFKEDNFIEGTCRSDLCDLKGKFKTELREDSTIPCVTGVDCEGYRYYKGYEYIGKVINERNEGEGVLKFKNGNKLEVVYKKGKLAKKGKLTYSTEGYPYKKSFDKAVYEGEYMNDDNICIPSGRGKLTEVRNNKIFEYEGIFVDGKISEGKLKYPNGTEFYASFIDGKPNGKGTVKTEGGAEKGGMDITCNFYSSFIPLKRCNAKIKIGNNEEFEGICEFCSEKTNEKISVNPKIISGTLKKNGKTYKFNSFKNGNPIGKGIVEDDKYIYEGEVDKNGKKIGEGKLTFKCDNGKNQIIYEGEFKNDLMHGYGFYYGLDGSKYHGYFKNGQKNSSNAAELYSNNSKYEGGFKNGKRYGHGIFTTSNGRRYEGLWSGDTFVNDEDEKIYEFKNGKIVLQGKKEEDNELLDEGKVGSNKCIEEQEDKNIDSLYNDLVKFDHPKSNLKQSSSLKQNRTNLNQTKVPNNKVEKDIREREEDGENLKFTKMILMEKESKKRDKSRINPTL